MAVEKKQPKQSLRPLVPHITADAPALLAGTAALLISSASNAAAPTVLRRVVDASAQDVRSQILRALSVFAAGAAASAVRTAALDGAQLRIERRLRAAAVAATLQRDKSFFDQKKGCAEIMSVVHDDVQETSRAASVGAANLLRMLSSVIGGLVSAATVSGRLTVITLTMVPAVAFTALRLYKLLNAARAKLRAVSDAQTDFLNERFGSISTVKLFGGEDATSAELAGLQARSGELESAVSRLDGVYFGALDLAAKATLLTVLTIGGGLIRRGQLTGGQLLSFALHSALLGLGLGGLTRGFGEVSRGMVAARRVAGLISSAPAKPSDSAGASGKCTGRVDLQNVSFAYPARRSNVLRGLSMSLHPGKITALVGGNGAGKTTVASLVGGLYEPSEGAVLLDGVDVRTMHPDFVRRNVGVVEQDAALFRGTVRENIAFACPDASQKQVELAAQQAGAASFIESLADGYDTDVGPRGQKLSGGQRQRIAIARALMRDPRVLVLDEATSALDAESELCVRDAMTRAVAADRAVFVIAHRESTVKMADMIYVMESGQVADAGTFAELISADSGKLRDLLLAHRQQQEAGESSDGGGEAQQPEDAR